MTILIIPLTNICSGQTVATSKTTLEYKIDTGIRLKVGLVRKATHGQIERDILQWVFDHFDTTGGTGSIATGSRTATGDYLHHWSGYLLGFDSVGIGGVRFTNLLGNFETFFASGRRFSLYNHSNTAMMDVKDGGVSGSDTVAIKGWPRLPATVPNEFVTVDAAGNWCHSAISVPVSVNKVALLAQTGAITASSYPSVTNAWYEVKGFVNVLNIATDVLNVQVVFTDENGNAQTKLIPAVNSAGTAAVNMGSVDHYSFSMPVYGKTATTIRVNVLLATGGGSDTYDIYVNTVKQ